MSKYILHKENKKAIQVRIYSNIEENIFNNIIGALIIAFPSIELMTADEYIFEKLYKGEYEVVYIV